jgi:hypothetical protein
VNNLRVQQESIKKMAADIVGLLLLSAAGRGLYVVGVLYPQLKYVCIAIMSIAFFLIVRRRASALVARLPLGVRILLCDLVVKIFMPAYVALGICYIAVYQDAGGEIAFPFVVLIMVRLATILPNGAESLDEVILRGY